MGGGAWPFLVGGVICLVDSVNERDLGLLNSRVDPSIQNRRRGRLGGFRLFRGSGLPPAALFRRSGRRERFLEGPSAFSRRRLEAITGL
jgi:hypothetical protein